MDLNHVAAFVRVVHEGSFTAAAKALGIPKSSVSRSIAQLERDLGVVLLHRTTRKVHLTEAGAAFHGRVARALADIDDAQNVTSDLQRELRGLVRITAPVDLAITAIAPIVARFVRKHPSIQIETYLAQRVVDIGGEGFDLAVRAGSIRDQSLIARRIGPLELGLYASRKYLERRPAPTSVEDLAKHECIVFRTDQGTLSWRLKDRDFEPAGAILANDISFLKRAVLAGGGIAILPLFLVEREEEAGKLVRLFPDWRIGGSELHVLYPSARYVPQRVVVFRDYLIEQLKKVVRRCEQLAHSHAERSRIQRA